MFSKKYYCFIALSSLFLFLLSCKRSVTLFESLPPSATNIEFANNLDMSKSFRVLYFFYYYNGGGVATGDINNDGLPDIYFTANSKGGNKLYLNKGNFKFEDITEKAGVVGSSDWCTGVTMADVNGDGYLDIYVSSVNNVYNFKGRNELFINNQGNGSFTESAEQYGLAVSSYANQASFFDYDHDGDLDCYVLNESFKPAENVVDTSNRRKFDANSGDRLFRNDVGTTGKFTDVSTEAGIYQSALGYGLGIAVADFNNDGWEDIYIGNDFHENDYYYLNNGNGTFSESGAEHFKHYSRFSMGNDAADYNNDGQLDIFTADMLPPDEKTLKTYGSGESPDIYKFMITKNGFQPQYSKNCLQRNNGNGVSFSDVSLINGVAATDWSWCPLFADFDNDGNKDLFISTGIVKRTVDMDYIRFISNLYIPPGTDPKEKYNEALAKIPDGASHNFIFQGKGNEGFMDKSDEWGLKKGKGYFNGAAYADLDNDGDLDLVVNSINAPAAVYKNNTTAKSYINISFKGDGLNTNGIGAKAYLFASNKMQYQQLMLTRGFQSSSDTRLHFGLESTKTIDSILIVWPNQKIQTFKNITSNRLLIIEQKNAEGNFVYADYFKLPKEIFSVTGDLTTDSWQHKENDFNDFNYQYLIPHKESTRGPKMAVADINKDGLEDFFVCGAKDQAGALMMQLQNGKFASIDTALFGMDKICEDADAVFFDANGDDNVDLLVVSGGNEFSGISKPLLDRLYINDGKGNFTKSPSFPQTFENKSCVSVTDIDKDGDIDIFMGTLASPKAYGIPQTSFLLLNDGKGNFSKTPENIIPLSNIGMVTSSAFADVNKDGKPDLIVAGEWMPLTIFINQNGKFSKTIIPNSTGLWQTVFADDVNKDGNVDILCGNWGWNNKFYSNKEGKIKLYAADFDKNGKTEQLLSYHYQNNEYPFLAKDMVEQQLPLLKKHYLLYAEYAGLPMKDVFYGWIDTVKPFTAEHLGSSICYGDGKGKFTLTDLPAELQLAPIFSFAPVTSNNTGSYLAAGNFYGTIPYEGRYDALQPTFFSFDKKNNTLQYNSQIASVTGEARDAKWINHAGGGKLLIIARNNQPLIFLKPAAFQ
jgi:enediyne biosynthesis protein E4